MEPRNSASEAARPFDALGLGYEQAFGHQPARRAALDWIVAQLPAGARVLDVGCGTGRPTAEVLAAAGHAVTGIDVSATMVELARRQVPGARFEQADVRDFAAADASWDAVCAFFSLLQMPRRDLDATLRRIAGWLAPGGAFVLAAVPVDIEELDIEFMGQPLRVTSYPTERYLELLRGAGLEIVDVRTDRFQPDYPGMGEEEDLFVYARRPR